MTQLTTCFFFFFSFSFLFLYVSVSCAETQTGDRAPHGLANQNPVSLSPSSYDFFHPNDDPAHQPAPATARPCSMSKCSSYSMSSTAAQVRATEVHQPTLPGAAPPDSKGVGPSGIAGIVVGLAVALLVAMGAYYVVLTRRSNSQKLNSPCV